MDSGGRKTLQKLVTLVGAVLLWTPSVHAKPRVEVSASLGECPRDLRCKAVGLTRFFKSTNPSGNAFVGERKMLARVADRLSEQVPAFDFKVVRTGQLSGTAPRITLVFSEVKEKPFPFGDISVALRVSLAGQDRTGPYFQILRNNGELDSSGDWVANVLADKIALWDVKVAAALQQIPIKAKLRSSQSSSRTGSPQVRTNSLDAAAFLNPLGVEANFAFAFVDQNGRRWFFPTCYGLVVGGPVNPSLSRSCAKADERARWGGPQGAQIFLARIW